MKDNTAEEPYSYWGIIIAEVRYDKDLTMGAKVMYAEISSLVNVRGHCWASNSYFAKHYDTAPETISRWISSLQEKGYIRIEIDQESGNKRKIYLTRQLLTQESIATDQMINTPIDRKIKHKKNTINKNKEESSTPSQAQETTDFIIDFVDKEESSLEEKIIKKFHALFCKFRTKPGKKFSNKTLSKSKMSAWKSDLDKLMRIDERSREDLLEVFYFLEKGNDTFWRNTIYSIGAIREYWDKIQDKMTLEAIKNSKKEEQKEVNNRVLPGVFKK